MECTDTSFEETYTIEDSSSDLFDGDMQASSIEIQQEEARKLRQKLLMQEMQILQTASRTNMFTSFNGWGSSAHTLFSSTQGGRDANRLQALTTPDLVDSRMGGYFLQWEGKGVAINPGKNFLERFFKKGHHIREIDYVVVTTKESTAWSDLEKIYSINKEINTLLQEYEKESHFISYLLHPVVFATAARLFRPSCREEANAVKSLETFSAQECISLSPSIDLFYAPSLERKEGLLLRFELTTYEQEKIVLGYLSQIPWKERYVEFFATCQYCVLGLGKSDIQDVEKLVPSKSSLGYFGAYSALQALESIRVALFSEYVANLGDIRLELVRKMRDDLEVIGKKSCSLFPVEQDLAFDLASCSLYLNGEIVPIESVRIVRLQEPFSPLLFVSYTNVC